MLKYIYLKLLFVFAAIIWAGCGSPYGPDFDYMVAQAVERQIERYPESTLQDLYKNFAQDYWGPGHLIPDPARADAYLRHELDEMSRGKASEIDPAWVEPTGWRENYVRVDLALVRDSILPYDLFFDAFMQSANEADSPTLAAWKKEWAAILAVIEKQAPDLPDLGMDKRKIGEMLARGETTVHHSRAYERAYHPHYRVVRSDIFYETLEPYVSGSIEFATPEVAPDDASETK